MQVSSPRRIFVFLSLALAACGSSPTPSADSGGEAAPKEQVPAKVAVVEGAPSRDEAAAAPKEKQRKKTAPLSEEEVNKGRKRFESFSEKLNAGRKASKAGKHKEAIGYFDGALELRHAHPAVMGELGWAYFKMEDFEAAEGYTRLALERATEPKRRGALFYNLGRALEAQLDIEGAHYAYEDSLRARPSDTVTRRMNELPDPPKKVEVEVVPLEEGLRALCTQRLKSAYCQDVEITCRCSIANPVLNPAGGEHIIAAAILREDSVSDLVGEFTDIQLVIQTRSSGWQFSTILANDRLERDGGSAATEIKSLRFENLLGSAEAELVVETREAGYNRNYEFYCEEDTRRTHTAICSSQGEAGSCAHIETSYVEDSVPFGGRESEENKPEHTQWSYTLGYTGNSVILTYEGAGKVGETYEFEKLGEVSDVVVDGYH